MTDEAQPTGQPAGRDERHLPRDSMPCHTNSEVQLKFTEHDKPNYKAQDRGERIIGNCEEIGERG